MDDEEATLTHKQWRLRKVAGCVKVCEEQKGIVMAVPSGLAIVGGVVLAGIAVWQFNVATEAKREVNSLQMQALSRSAAELEQAKRTCADRSQRYFTSLGYDEAKAENDAMTTFQDHYSKRLSRCLMTIETTSYKPPRPVTTKTLFDTDERKTFGQYSWVASDTKKYSEQPPMQCSMTPPDKVEATCHSTDEYDGFVKEMLAS